MKIFVTGASGFIGSHLVPELIGAGHQVTGLARSDASAEALKKAGAEVHSGTIEDLDSLRSGVADAEAVIHLGFIHDFSRFLEVCELDRLAIEAMGTALGTRGPLIITSGVGMGIAAPGELANEDHLDPAHLNPRTASEVMGVALGEKGVDVRIVRLPQVHDPVKQGLVTYLVSLAREKGISAYVGDGQNRWSAGHVLDTAHLYRLVLEIGTARTRYNSVGEEGVPVKEIAEALGRGLKIPVVSLSPEEASEHFGWMGMFAGYDMPASSALTQERLGWKPTGPGLIADLDQMDYHL